MCAVYFIFVFYILGAFLIKTIISLFEYEMTIVEFQLATCFVVDGVRVCNNFQIGLLLS